MVADGAAALERSHWLRARYGCPVLVEQYLPGAEITVGITGNGPGADVLGMMEIASAANETPFVYSVDVKRDWRRRVRYHVPPRIPPTTRATLRRLALTAYRLLGCRDFARIDFRLDAAGAPTSSKCNPLPGLDPDNSDLVILCAPTRTYDALVQGVLLDARGADRRADRLSVARDGMKVLILHTAPPQTVDPGRRVWEFDLEPAACGIATVLPGATVARVRGEPREILSCSRPTHPTSSSTSARRRSAGRSSSHR